MAKVDRLPPPPTVPVRSPAAPVEGEESVTLHRQNGEPSLEARVRVPEKPERAVVLCHPHPLYGGSMHSPVILSIARMLLEKRGTSVATLRFNFRGVPSSEGTFDDGRGETDDVLAAIDALRDRAPGVPMMVCGHSFGSWTGLRGAAKDGQVERVALVAPSTRFFTWGREELPPFAGQAKIFIGDHDEYCDESEARELATFLHADIQIFPGFDHHFMRSRRALAEAVLPFLAPEAGA